MSNKPSSDIKPVLGKTEDDPVSAILLASKMPFNPPAGIAPVDNATMFTNGFQTMDGAGSYWGANPDPVDVGVGRVVGVWTLAFNNRRISPRANGNDQYNFLLFGCNDPSFPNGQVQTLQAQNYGNFVGRPGGVKSRSPGIPKGAGTPYLTYDGDEFPFSNFVENICYRYLKFWARLDGTSPSTPYCVVSSWITYDAM